MKKFSTLLFFTFLFTSQTLSLKAQCVPLSSSFPGVFPDTLVHGCLGEFYTDTVTLVFPEDTVVAIPPVGTFTIDFDSFVVETVSNLPPGITYTCTPSSCLIPHPPSGLPKGCLVFSGTPTDTTDITDMIVIEITNYITFFGNPLGTPMIIPMNIKIHGAATCATGIQNQSAESTEVRVFPNPAEGSATVSLDLRAGGQISLTLQDAAGRLAGTVFEGQLAAGQYSFPVNSTGALAPGVYFLKTTLESGLAGKPVQMVVIR